MVKFEKYTTKAGKTLWMYYSYYGVDEKTGKKIKLRGRGFNTKSEAKLEYERKLEELKEEDTATQKSKSLTFEELYNEYLVFYKESGVTGATYKKFKDETDRYILPSLKDIFIDKIEIEDCQKIYDSVKKLRKDHNKIINQLVRILDFAISKKYLKFNSAKNILKNKNKFHYKKRRLNPDENYYTPTELMKFLEAFEKVEEYHKFVYFRLIAFTGLRRGEALALYESDVLTDIKALNITKTITEDENGKTILQNHPKTETSKGIVYLDDDTFNYVMKLIQYRNSFDIYGKIVYFQQKNKFLFPSPKTQKFYHRSAPNSWLKSFFDRNHEELEKEESNEFLHMVLDIPKLHYFMN